MKNSDKIEAIIKIMTKVAADAHYEAADGEPEPYTSEQLTELYYDKIKQIINQ